MKILVALGGNAILPRGGKGTAEEQYSALRRTCVQLVGIVREGHRVVVTHGNGPQVGDILLAYDAAKEFLPPMPLDVCGAQSQGMIGYMIQLTLQNELAAAGLETPVASLLTRTVVDRNDPAFDNPTKPVGPFYSRSESEKLKGKGWKFVRDGRTGYRRVVPSPAPIAILELPTIDRLFEAGSLVIAAGGGGVPVVRNKRTGTYSGVEAVVDKDLASSLLAAALRMDLLLILTDVKGLFLGFGKRSQLLVREVNAGELRKLLGEGQFPAGSMGPKVEAVVEFVEKTGKPAVIASLAEAGAAVEGRAGTRIVP